MRLPDSLYLSLLKEGQIYFFSLDSSVGIGNHRHIFLKKSREDILFFSCCTSQEDTMNRLIQLQKLDPSTIVWIKPDACNGLKKDTFVNCNSIQRISKEEFIAACENNEITSMNCRISENHYKQIANGIRKSKLVSGEVQECFPEEE